ncbi:Dynein light chain [Spironucleus salmonicida]|uniref:Dynein light chain n=1 Tax=Spironucleus salmonicida TaxID=348837 RepID=V6LL00_9EUKA|nr:Dynein light chain [Spironucleus salmonicida]|eukprot:EST44416.1 Dynein light chain [Spironucleus salmonicida]
MDQCQVEQTISRITQLPGVQGILVLLDDGQVLRTTFDEEMTQKYTRLILQFALLAIASIRDADPQNELNYCRVRSDKREIVVIPDQKWFIVVVSNMDAEFRQ